MVERKNRSITGIVRSMLKEKHLPLELWGEAVSTCVFVVNRVNIISPTKVNILNLGKLDDDGFTSTLGGGILSIFDNKGKVFARIRKTSVSMYLLKLNNSEFGQITKEEEHGVWLWHHRLCHQSFRAIDDMRRSDMVRGLPNFCFSDHLCRNCVAGKHNRSAFPNES